MTEKEMQELQRIGVDISQITEESIWKAHMLNIGVAVVMILIGGILIFKTRRVKSGGMKTAGWILLALGITVTVVHIAQMLL